MKLIHFRTDSIKSLICAADEQTLSPFCRNCVMRKSTNLFEGPQILQLYCPNGLCIPTHTHALTHTHTRTHPYAHTPTHTHTHTHTCFFFLALSMTFSVCLFLLGSSYFSVSVSESLSLSLSHCHTPCLFLSIFKASSTSAYKSLSASYGSHSQLNKLLRKRFQQNN